MRARFLLPLLLIANFAHAAHAPIVTAHLYLSESDKQNTAMAAVAFDMPEGWHIYWQNPGDAGLETSLAWTLPSGVSAGDISWPAPERIQTGDSIVNYGYNKRAVLLVPLKAARKNTTGDVGVKASWLVCKDICIPESATLSAPWKARDADAARIVDEAKRSEPKPLPGKASYALNGARVVLSVDAPGPWGNAPIIFIPLEDGIISNSGAQEATHDGAHLTLSMPRGNQPLLKEWHGVLRAGEASFDVTAPQASAPPPSRPAASPHGTGTLAGILLLALAGGLLLNLMPCVLPILSLKALALVKKAGVSPREARLQGISYALGVIASFLLIAALMLGLRQAGASFGWGFQLQQPGFVAGLFLLMLLVALNLFGLFELPPLFANLKRHPDEAKIMGSFMTGVLAVAVATPCTAPFMATAIGATLSLSVAPALLVFAAIGLGMALPFLLVSLSPRTLRLLPKPGPWMLRFRQLLGVLMLLTAAWLLEVLAALAGPAAMDAALSAACGLMLLAWLSRAPRFRRLASILIVILAIGLIAFQPRTGSMPSPAMDAQSEPFSETRLAQLRTEGTPVFVDATAAWCITCKLNEHTALDTDKVEAYFHAHHIVRMVADWSNGDPAITTYLGTFGRNGVPLYVYYPPHGEPQLLPQLLTPSLVLRVLAEHE